LEREWRSEPSRPSGAKIEALEECLEATPEPSRRLLKLRYFEGHSCEEVAKRTGVGLDAIYKRVSRLHESLKNCVEGKLRAAKSATERFS
jgi:RNA polymerase sigma factor (sigma-70 family)